jgi:hypothetical protein
MAIFPSTVGGDVPFAKHNWDKDHPSDRNVLLKTLPGAVKLVLHYSINPPPEAFKPSVGRGIYLEEEPTTSTAMVSARSKSRSRHRSRKVAEISPIPPSVSTLAHTTPVLTSVISRSSSQRNVGPVSLSSTSTVVVSKPIPTNNSSASVVSRARSKKNPKLTSSSSSAIVTKRDGDIAVMQDSATNAILAQLRVNQDRADKDREVFMKQFALAEADRNANEKRFAQIFGILGIDYSAKRAKTDEGEMEHNEDGEEY